MRWDSMMRTEVVSENKKQKMLLKKLIEVFMDGGDSNVRVLARHVVG